MTAPAFDRAVAGLIALCTGVESVGAGNTPSADPYLGQCLSAKAEDAMAWNNHLPERQQKSLSRLPELSTADRVPNSEKLDGKWRSLRRC